MNITITINTDNAAFEDDPSSEVARILRQLIDRLTRGAAADDLQEADGIKLRDINGNMVGSVSVEEDEDEDDPSAVRQTTCRHCEQDIEGYPNDPTGGDWRDRGNNTHCPTPEGDAGQVHEPVED